MEAVAGAVWQRIWQIGEGRKGLHVAVVPTLLVMNRGGEVEEKRREEAPLRRKLE